MSDTDYEFEEEEFTTQFNGGTVWRILAQTRPHWPYLVAFLLLIGLVSGLDSYFTFLSKRIIDEGIVAQDSAALMRILLQYGALIVVQALGVFGFIYLTGVLGEMVRYDLRKRLFNHLQSLSLSYYSRTPVGWIMSRVTSDTDRIAELVTWGILDVSWGLMNILTAAYFMLYINVRLGLIVLLIIPILVVVAAQFKKRILVQYRVVRKTNSKITGAYNENITGVRVAKSLGREEANLVEFNQLTEQMYRSSYRAAWLSALFLPVVQLISAFGVGAIAWYGGWQTTIGGMTVGGIQAFVSYVTFMLWPIQEMARVYAEMQQSIASAERVFSLEDAVPDIADRPGAFDPGSLRGDIEFDKVAFYYEADKPVLHDFNLTVRQGETIALVGPTGGGKSTIVNLLCRFYEPREGTVRIAGHDYTQLSLHAIQSRIGIVLQTPHLFSGSVRENIRYGRLDASDAEVEAAAQMAGAHDFIKTLTHGYDENVGEGGGLLSVGQKQLISLARAILADPELFIMDEATSSVDTLTEALIQQGMEVLLRDRTSFVIAHRLSTIRRADRILVIEDGTITEMGTHAELIRARGHYYKLYTQQFRHELEQTYEQYEREAFQVVGAV
ncbi:MAG: ABC transporter ATP-binding protein [Ardenticatenaceae bacterium]|nr:ABC transporter ATP-binding protein [Anaerolineales bacterium]MCB8919843.1 ABC transporter ATP-binding protein [Ardenticatenaceae bacterium]